jgi:hypothetical protein
MAIQMWASQDQEELGKMRICQNIHLDIDRVYQSHIKVEVSAGTSARHQTLPQLRRRQHMMLGMLSMQCPISLSCSTEEGATTAGS